MKELWPFQFKLVSETRAALRQWRSVCMVAPTGSGKTVMAGFIAVEIHKQLGHKSGSSLYLVHRAELLMQTENTLKEIGLGDAYGVLAPRRPAKPWAPIQIASIPYVVRHLDDFPWLDPKAIYVDEGHHATARTWMQIITKWKRAFVIFMTATPMRNDDTGLGDIIDHLVLGPQISDLVPDGHLAPTRTFDVPPDFSAKKMTLKAQAAMQTSAVIAKCVDTWQRIRPDGRTIFFAVNIDHSLAIVADLRSRGIRAAHVDYKTPERERAQIFKDMKHGAIQCVSNVKLFTEGTDWKECDTIVLARNTGSLVDYRQMNGRGMRAKPSARENFVIDCSGNIYLHGYPDDDIEWELDFGTDVAKQKAKALTIQICEACGHVYPKGEPECPLCGCRPLRPEILEVDQDVSEVTGDIKRDPPKKNSKKPKPTRKQITAEVLATGGDMEKLRSLGRKYGYHSNWPIRMKEIYGRAFRQERMEA